MIMKQLSKPLVGAYITAVYFVSQSSNPGVNSRQVKWLLTSTMMTTIR